MNQSIHQSLTVNTFNTKFSGFKSELHMQGVIYENQELIAFGENNAPNIIATEFYLPNNAGRIDILVESDLEIGIVELKNKEICLLAVDQIKRYLDSAYNNPDVFKEILKRDESIDNSTLYGVLVGSSISVEALAKIIESNKNNNYKIYVILLTKHITDNDNLFIVSTPIISKGRQNEQQANGRDYTKYLFNGKTFGKSRLVLAVMNYYINHSQNITLLELQNLFPDSLQGTYQTIESLEKLDNRKYSRYFINDQILFNNEELVVCTQWKIDNIERFINKASELGYKIEKINQ